MYVYIYNNLFPTKLGKGQKQTKKGKQISIGFISLE